MLQQHILIIDHIGLNFREGQCLCVLSQHPCPGFPTYLSSLSFTLTDDLTGLYVPEGLAHGFLTLEDNTLVAYLMSNYYHPECERGIRWDDPLFHLSWPRAITMVSAKGKNWPDFPKGVR